MNTSAFDNYAPDYDASFTNTGVGRSLRALVWAHADALFQPGQRILELGCGTGEDAVHFASRGVEVVATDAASVMVEVARRKAEQRGCVQRIEFHAVGMEQAAALLQPRQFDGVFSNFGAVNCAANLHGLAASIAGVLEPGAPLLWVVMGRHVPWEWAWYFMRGQPGKSLRRLNKDGVEWRNMRIIYPTPASLSKALQPHFNVTRIAPMGCFLPPSYAAAWLNRSPRMLSAFTAAERWAQRSESLARCADHYVIEARRR